jgi:hypothetical protein
MSDTVEGVDEQSLTTEDRCDRCGSQAYVRATLEAGTELLFCGHHWREHGDKVRTLAVTIHDETPFLEGVKG